MSDISGIVDRAITASRGWADAVPATRSGWLRAIADRLDAHADDLVALADTETHLGSPRLRGELARTTAQLRKFGDVVDDGAYLEATIDHADPADVPPRPDLRRLLVPLGPVAVWSASNFPFAFSVVGGDTASALAAGNAVIVKAHDGHPALSRRVADLAGAALAEVGAPEHSIQLVHTRAEGVELVQHPGITAGAFTGSIPGGRALFDLAAARSEPIPFYGELGSLNPVVLTERAAIDRRDELADGLVQSFTMGAGQFCTKPGVVFVPRGSGFIAAVADRITAVSPAPMLNDRIRSGFASRATAVVGNAEVEIVGGTLPEDDAVGPLLLRVDARALRSEKDAVLEEIFGPATLFVEYDTEDELLAALSMVPGSLTGTIHAVDGEDVGVLVRAIAPRVGRLLFAGWPTGVAVSWAQHHGGPYPATTSVFTSVGATAIRRFLRPLTYQSAPELVLPAPLVESNPWGIPRRVDGVREP